MPRREKYVPKHRTAPREPALGKGLRKALMVSGVAAAATGVAVSSGIATQSPAPADTASATLSASGVDPQDGVAASTGTTGNPGGRHRAESARVDTERGHQVSRSAARTAIDPQKKKELTEQTGGQVTRTEDLTKQDPRTVAKALMPDFGFSVDQWSCLDQLWISESSWDPHADNPTSTAYGIPQALIGEHDNLPADYMTNPVSQIRWGLGYIRDAYGTPCAAWAFKQGHHWY